MRDLLDGELLFTPNARALAGRDLATWLLRYEIARAGAEGDTRLLPQLVALADAFRIPVVELRRISGFARDTLARARQVEFDSDRRTPRDDELMRVLALLAALAALDTVPIEDIAATLRMPDQALMPVLRELVHDGLLEDAHMGNRFDVRASAHTEHELRRRATELELGLRNDTYMVWFAVSENKAAEVGRIAAELSEGPGGLPGLRDWALAPPPGDANSDPELGLAVRATHRRAAVEIAHEYWQQIQKTTRIPPTLVAFSDPPTLPAAPSQVLDGFVAGMVETIENEESQNRVEHTRATYFGGETERTLAKKCLTEAARARRRLAGESEPTVEISDGERAFRELEALVRAKAESAPLVMPLQKGLRLAADRLGPYRGGELGSFKAPEGVPNVVREIAPKPEELARMAYLAGAALAGAGSDVAQGAIDAIVG